MKIFLASFLLLGVALAQQCICKHDGVNGWFDGDTCNICDSDKTGYTNAMSTDPLPTGQTAKCTGYKFCDDPNRPELWRNCNNNGLCNENAAGEADSCTCNYENLSGLHCEKCANGRFGWPDCLTETCDATTTCNKNGQCNNAYNALETSYNCGGSRYYPNTHVCFTKVHPQTGVVTYTTSLRSDNKRLCGNFAECDWNKGCSVETDEFSDLEGEAKELAAANPFCFDKSKTVCFAFWQGPSLRSLCDPWETCCDGTCCNSNQVCLKRHNQRGFLNVPMGTYTKETQTRTYASTSAALEWGLSDGTTVSELPKVCSTEGRMDSGAVIKAIVLPIFLMIALAVSALMVFKTTGISPYSVGVPALVIVFCSLWLCLTRLWATGILLSLSAFIALGAIHKNGDYVLYGLFPQMFILAIICGGFGLGSFWISGADNVIFSVDNEVSNCKNYYGYFGIDGQNMPWDWDLIMYPSKGLCGTGWLSFMSILTVLAVTAKIVMLVASGVEWLGGGGKM